MAKNSKPNPESLSDSTSIEESSSANQSAGKVPAVVPRQPLLFGVTALALAGWMIFLAIVAFFGL